MLLQADTCECRCHVEEAIAEMKEDGIMDAEFPFQLLPFPMLCKRCEGVCCHCWAAQCVGCSNSLGLLNLVCDALLCTGTCPEGHPLLEAQVFEPIWNECSDCGHYVAPGNLFILTSCEQCKWVDTIRCNDRDACRAQALGVCKCCYS